MFDQERQYGDYNNGQKTCALCNNGLPLRTYCVCDGCKQYFCYNHRPLFVKEWFCPLCEENFKKFIQPLKEANVEEFFKKLG